MTEAEWLASEDLDRMFEVPGLPASSRKLRLFGVACCRGWDAFSDPKMCLALDFAERHADGRADDRERAETVRAIGDVDEERWEVIRPDGGSDHDPIYALIAREPYTADDAAGCAWQIAESAEYYDSRSFDGLGAETISEHCNFLREIFGNPFRPVTFDPAWRASDVMLLAQGIYDEKAFDRMPILADALQDAGCDSPDILDHCRDPHAAHVRGCWVIDLALGKE